MADIEERLKSHSQAFDGLLSLIPADKYYEADNSNQWNKRKQTKEEKKRAKKAKLDPDSAAGESAADVRQKKQKEKKDSDGGEDEAYAAGDIEPEIPRAKQDRPKKTPKKPKKQPPQKNGEPTGVPVINGEQEAGEEEGEWEDADAEKPEPHTKTPKKQSKQQIPPPIPDNPDTPAPALKKAKADKKKAQAEQKKAEAEKKKAAPPASSSDDSDDEMMDVPGDGTIQIDGFSADSLSSDAPAASSSAASSSTAPTSASSPKPEKSKQTPEQKAELKARLQARIDALRAKRKADGPDGAPARNRQELMEARRKKEAARKERKKAMRLQAKVESEATAASSLVSSRATSTASPDISGIDTNSFSFGRVTFADGAELDDTLGGVKKTGKKKGPTDLLGQLKHVEAKKRRLEGYSEEKRAEIGEKDMWHKALKQTRGEKVKDDEKLLKKALKRQEKGKKKSEREWNERIGGIEKGKKQKAQKREANIQSRIDAKKAGKSGKKALSKKPKGKRPGFEGSMKSGKSKKGGK